MSKVGRFQKGKERAESFSKCSLVPDRAVPEREQESFWKINDIKIKGLFENSKVRARKLFAVDGRLIYYPLHLFL